MALDLPHLDASTRRCMVAELDDDLAAGTLYRSSQLNEHGLVLYHHLLRAALMTGTVDSFAEALSGHAVMRPVGRWHSSKDAGVGDALTAAAAILADREFHRFYIRGLCRRALNQGVESLVIYRARPPDAGRKSSDAMVGLRIGTMSLLEDLRGASRSLPPHGLPQCRDPGLSVRLP